MSVCSVPDYPKEAWEAAAQVKRLGRKAGFDLVRIARATELTVERDRYLKWIEDGRQGDMKWMTSERAERSCEPASILPNAASVICVGLSYWSGSRPKTRVGQGKIARYAWGSDYHSVLGERLEKFAGKLRTEFGGEYKWYVDTGPLMDKALASRSGVGFYGKNTNILTEAFGSFVLLGEIITTLDLPPDAASSGSCGSCRLCMVACPTGALGPEYSIDSRKCISYLTIEHRSAIPLELRDKMGDWVFGCDICQEVCPPTMEPHLSSRAERIEWIQEVRSYTGKREGLSGPTDPSPSVQEGSTWNGVPAVASETISDTVSNPLFEAGKRPVVDLIWLLHLTHDQYLEAFRGTAIRRAKDWMLRRNAAVALGNTGSGDAIAPLKVSLESDQHPVVRGHAAWALGKLGMRLNRAEARECLAEAFTKEKDPEVRLEIHDALGEAAG